MQKEYLLLIMTAVIKMCFEMKPTQVFLDFLKLEEETTIFISNKSL